MANIKVSNRSAGVVVYELKELKVRRVFNAGESKEITIKELDALWQMHGGAELIKDELLVHDKEWCKKNWDPPIEYFWGYEDIVKCLKEDSLELFSESIDFAPGGVRELIKQAAWQLPLTDLNKINVIQTKMGFNVQAAIKIMAHKTPKVAPAAGRQRLRKED